MGDHGGERDGERAEIGLQLDAVPEGAVRQSVQMEIGDDGNVHPQLFCGDNVGAGVREKPEGHGEDDLVDDPAEHDLPDVFHRVDDVDIALHPFAHVGIGDLETSDDTKPSMRLMVDITDEFPGPFPAPDDEHVPKVDPLAADLLQDEIDRALHG